MLIKMEAKTDATLKEMKEKIKASKDHSWNESLEWKDWGLPGTRENIN
jgi:hypothetical protein